jgi:predicted aspartyl protease
VIHGQKRINSNYWGANMTNLKSTILLLAFTILLSSNVIAEGINKIPQLERVPAITLDEAIALVKTYHNKSSLSSEKIFIDEAVLIRINGKCFWKVGYRLQARETGHMYVKVSMDGKVQIDSVVKDG